MGGTAVWQRRDVVMGGNLSTEFKLPKAGAKGGKSDTLCSMNANLNNKGNGQVRRDSSAGTMGPALPGLHVRQTSDVAAQRTSACLAVQPRDVAHLQILPVRPC